MCTEGKQRANAIRRPTVHTLKWVGAKGGYLFLEFYCIFIKESREIYHFFFIAKGGKDHRELSANGEQSPYPQFNVCNWNLDVVTGTGLYRNKRFVLNLMLQRNASIFAKFLFLRKSAYYLLLVLCDMEYKQQSTQVLLKTKIWQILKRFTRALSLVKPSYF